MSPLQRFFRFVVQDGDCWRWLGSNDGRKGYGRFTDEAGRTVSAHRWIYAQLVADIPDGLQIDHLCGNPWCVNAYEHMEPVPSVVNTARAERHFGRKTHCPKGHVYDNENTRYTATPRGGVGRSCRACNREYVALRRACGKQSAA